MRYTMTVEPYSDDIVIFKIRDNEIGKTLFEDETYKTDAVYDVNGDFKIVIQFDKSPVKNWTVGIGDLNEDAYLDEIYSIHYELDAYRPILHVKSDKPFVIEGLYGTREVDLKSKLQSIPGGMDDEDADRVIELLKKEKLL